MREGLTISALAKKSGVGSKTLRYWEALGLLPKAERTHTGYRVFATDALRYVGFVRKSKAIGLTLAEMHEVLRMARSGHCPCPEVMAWTAERAKSLEQEIRSLTVLLKRMKRIALQWSRKECRCDDCGGVCSLVADLPECNPAEGGKRHAKTLAHSSACCDVRCRERGAAVRGNRKLLPAKLPAVLPVLSRQIRAAKSRPASLRYSSGKRTER